MALIIGHHARKGKTSYLQACAEAFDVVREYLPCAVPCAAFFIAGPRSARINLSREVAAQLGARRDGALLFHASYMDLPWLARDDVMARIEIYMELCALSRADLVVHASQQIFDEELNGRIMAQLYQRARAGGEQRIFVELMTDARFADVRRVNALFDNIARVSARTHACARIGVCVDTAHIWAAGADISSEEDCYEWLRGIRADIPIAVHLNDSPHALGSHRDAHACLGEGEIWKRESGYMGAIEFAMERGNVPIILERNGDPLPDAMKDYRAIFSKLNI